MRWVLVGLLLISQASANQSFLVCTNYHCSQRVAVSLNSEQWQQVRMIFKVAKTKNAKLERQQIGQAVALLERQVGEITGTKADLGKNFAGSGLAGQLDCIAESKNTSVYLQLMQNDSLLKYHQVKPRQIRRRFLVAEHWAGVIEEIASQQKFAVDSWYLDNGELPYIQPLQQWLKHKKFTD